MRSHRLDFPIVLLCICSAVGCAPVPGGNTPKKSAVSDDEQIRHLLARFEEGVRCDDVPRIMSLYSPWLTPKELQKERRRIESAVKSFRYSEYRLFYRPDDLNLPAESLRKGGVQLKVRFSRPGEKTADDVFAFRREDGLWHLRSVGMETPDKGERADLQAEESKQIADVVSQCNQAILSGDMESLTAVISNDRPPAERAEIKADIVDLLKFHKYQYFSSTYSRSALEIEFGPRQSLGVPLDFMYVRHDGVRGERKLRFCFRRIEGRWQLVNIDQRDSSFWKSFGKIALPLIGHAASQAGRLF